ncbi:hypothetical protein B0H16DRAFT_1898185 [Mycena metata]|uniref:DUF6534 domain-containing protein n=1 Tax=Mycena metata TaxID=1033252 RepID=A0AAD7HCQ7_9AGAR|nr:hypothetical protein B0H16DRAFT_1898185 [Mycena metata]
MSPFVSPTAPLPGATMVVIPPNITGPTLLGILFNWGLMGVLAVQLCSLTTMPYCQRIPDLFPPNLFYENSRDRPAIKALVSALAVLDIVQTVMVTADAFHWFVYGFGNPIQLDEPFFNPWDVPVLDSVISLIVQAFYCWRIYFLRKGVVIPVLILIPNSLRGSGVRNYQIGHLSFSREYIVAETIWLAGGAVADLAIAGVLSWILLSARNSSRPQYNSMLSRLIRLIVETNALTAGVAVVAIALFWGFPGSALVSVPIAIIGKLYTNCLLALFNNRKREETAKSRDGHGLVSLRVSPNFALQKTSDSHLYQCSV